MLSIRKCFLGISTPHAGNVIANLSSKPFTVVGAYAVRGGFCQYVFYSCSTGTILFPTIQASVLAETLISSSATCMMSS